jgi:RNA polymerase sigma-70 factor (ECF subfamily)
LTGGCFVTEADFVTQADFAAVRSTVRSFCYQMLGSPFDAEDAAQDVLERAWRARDRFDPGRASWTTWCLRIARNLCIDRLREVRRRPLPHDVRQPGIDVGAPLVPALDVPWLMPAPGGWAGSSGSYESSETEVVRIDDVRFAVTTLLQTVPPLQRGAFILREILDFSAAETAEIMGTTVAAVNSALQRARKTVRNGTRSDAPVDRRLVDRYCRALTRADVAALVGLVREDLVFEMPPIAAWSIGVEPYRAFMQNVFERRGTRWHTRITDAGGEPAVLLYLNQGDRPVPHTLHLVRVDAAGTIDRILVYAEPRLFLLFEDASTADR